MFTSTQRYLIILSTLCDFSMSYTAMDFEKTMGKLDLIENTAFAELDSNGIFCNGCLSETTTTTATTTTMLQFVLSL